MNKKIKQVALPKQRFPEFQDTRACEKLELSKLLVETKKRNRELKYDKNDVLSVSGEFGCVNQIEFLGRSYAGVSVENYHVVETGDIVYTKSPLKKNPYGIIKENKGKPGIVSTLYAVYRTTSLCNPDYLDHYFSRDYNLNSYLQPLVNKGAKNDMKVKNSDVLKGSIFVPDIPEQKKISNFLSSIAIINELEKKKLDALQEYKKGLLRSLFPVNGKSLPKVRFPEFRSCGDWKRYALGDLADRITLRNNDELEQRILTNSATDGVVDQRDYFDKDIANKKNLGNYYILEKGDFVYNPRTSASAPVGPISRNNLGRGVMSPLYTLFRFRECDSDFLEYFFKSPAWHSYLLQQANNGARHDRISITNNDFMAMPIWLPSPKERRKITEFCSCVDNLILAQAERVKSITTHQLALMQQLFPSVGEVMS